MLGFEQREAALYAQPRLTSRDLRYQPKYGSDEDPKTRKLCLCQRAEFPMVVGFQCSLGEKSGIGEHVRWPSTIAEKIARLKGLQQ